MNEVVTHRRPPHNSWKLPCCKRFIFFMPDTDLVTHKDNEVTCKGEADE